MQRFIERDITANIDDSCLQGRTKQQCGQNVSDTVHLLDNLGVSLNTNKRKHISQFCIEFSRYDCKITGGKERYCFEIVLKY